MLGVHSSFGVDAACVARCFVCLSSGVPVGAAIRLPKRLPLVPLLLGADRFGAVLFSARRVVS